MKLLLLFIKVEAEACLLVLTLLQLSEIDAKVELLELVLTTELDAVEGSWVVTALLLDRTIVLTTHVVALDNFVRDGLKDFELALPRVTVSLKRLSAATAVMAAA